MASIETSPQLGNSSPSPPSDSSRTSTMTMALSPDIVASDDDMSDDDSFSDFDVVPCNPNLGFAVDAQQGQVNEPNALKPVYDEELRQIFSEYEKLLQRPTEKGKWTASPDENSTASSLSDPEIRPGTLSDPKLNDTRVTRKHRPGTLRGNTGRVKKNISRAAAQPVRRKRALASRAQEYEYTYLGDARQAANGSIEVEVYWAPMFLTCDQLRGEQALEEAKGLVVKKFGQAMWDREESRMS
ncbi:hypothetical protein QQS21_003805 [Conoideocrella luteorostrata]|uniref:Uncharacterized protein n=1 Tax=Conoideocrella luteorostrata TaxID=1105319 RepID=A0AAJ0FV81_9HYPO|nr:hypothetical protein QQS21_003805 [Conoideocrella luteorostrata]